MYTITSIAEALVDGANRLRKAGVPEARREAGSLLAHVINRDRTYLISHGDDPVTPDELDKFSHVIEERAQGKPLQYITGHQEFFGLDFEVSTEVLIPRPETELLIETALDLVKAEKSLSICDLGTGSGCIVVTLALFLPQSRGAAIDISPAALEVAKRNAERHGVSERIDFVVSDCFSELNLEEKMFDLIVSNPPYVAEKAFEGLQREVRDFEPRVALLAGVDGLDVLRRLVKEGKDYLKTGGHLLLEIGFDQNEAVRNLIDNNTWRLLDVHRDLQGIPRTVALEKI
jgi:release factor glutamine methyltransferase